jgi:hypothetical protein
MMLPPPVPLQWPAIWRGVHSARHTCKGNRDAKKCIYRHGDCHVIESVLDKEIWLGSEAAAMMKIAAGVRCVLQH